MKILIVDDVEEVRESLHNIIKVKIDDTYEIAEAKDGLDALLAVDSFHPDIILTDILMPNMDGIRLTSILKSQAQTRHIFIAAITGLSGEDEIHKIYDSGVDFYIAKPFQLDDIVARLKVITSLITHKSSIPETGPSVVYNCFYDVHIKHYFITFSVSKEDDIFLIFDYFTNQNITYNQIVLKDFIVTLVKTYRKMDNINRVFNLIIEESDSYIYITVNDESFIKTAELLAKSDKNSIVEYSSNKSAFSFRINIVSFLEKNNNQYVVSYQNELISASELMMISTDDRGVYVSELRDSLHDYNLLCKDDSTYNVSLNLLLGNLFDKYTSLFKKIPEFDRVSIALQSIAILIKNNKTKKFNQAQNRELIKSLSKLNAIISSWIEDVIVNQDSEDVHYLDHKIMSVCSLIEEKFN